MSHFSSPALQLGAGGGVTGIGTTGVTSSADGNGVVTSSFTGSSAVGDIVGNNSDGDPSLFDCELLAEGVEPVADGGDVENESSSFMLFTSSTLSTISDDLISEVS